MGRVYVRLFIGMSVCAFVSISDVLCNSKKRKKEFCCLLRLTSTRCKARVAFGHLHPEHGRQKISLQQLDAKRTGKKILHYHRLLLLLCLREIRPTCTPLPAPAVLPARHLGKAIVTPLRSNRARPSPPPPSFASWGPRFGGPGR
jgi:hypothetical protein